MRIKKLLSTSSIWLMRHLSRQNFIFMLSIIIGLVAGLAGVALKTLVHYIELAVNSGFMLSLPRYFYLVFPMVGMLMSIAFVVYVNKNKGGHGIPNLLFNIARKGSRVEADKMYSQMATSALTVGFGGSVGLEAPIVTTGAAIGSNIAQALHLNYRKRTLFIGCGAAAALAAVFNAPITAVIFVLEVLLIELSIPSFIPLLLSAITATVVSKLLLGDEILFAFNFKTTFHIVNLPYYIMLGVFCGFVSLYFTRVDRFVEKVFHSFKGRFRKAILGGAILGGLIFLLPQLYGEGYISLKALLSGDTVGFLNFGGHYTSFLGGNSILLVVLALVLLKVFASSVTMAGGGNGGIFAPSLFTGGMLGYLFAATINAIGITHPLPIANFGLAGIAGMMSGVMHAPLTAIFLVMEITNTYDLILPLMTVSAIAYATVRYFDEHSIYTRALAIKGHLMHRNKDKVVLTVMRLEKVIEKDLETVHPDETLGALIHKVEHASRNIFPVIDGENFLMGIVTLDDIRSIMFDQSQYDTVTISSIMHQPPGVIELGEDMEAAMERFDKTGAWNLPVTQGGKYVGLISKSKVFSVYRSLLIRQGQE